eukprot:TRINITY_DN4811_c0_g1_i1.p1 TRINITY_DN4811_c0_g1~~TRINITY_DN4811_c0_g1_i1.p1  ORF type:complete len:137 (-),score=24.89 TRINITY_DN4811_c0_g1_i1:87-497(-)
MAIDNTLSFSKSEKNGVILWSSNNNRLKIWEGDGLVQQEEESQAYDVIFDKDAFGALPFELREKYSRTVSSYLKVGGYWYYEVKEKEIGRDKGPPFHVTSEVLKTFIPSYKSIQEGVNLYKISVPEWKQISHIFQK